MRETVKLLVLSSKISAAHSAAHALQKAGHLLFFSSDWKEAWQVLQLHGDAMDLVIVQVEGPAGGTPGLELIQQLKAKPSFSDLPILVLTDSWTAEECGKHQASALGANAYLRFPITDSQFLGSVHAIVGEEPPAIEVEPKKEATRASIPAPIQTQSQTQAAAQIAQAPTVSVSSGPGARAITSLRTIFLISELPVGVGPAIQFVYGGEKVETTAFTVTGAATTTMATDPFVGEAILDIKPEKTHLTISLEPSRHVHSPKVPEALANDREIDLSPPPSAKAAAKPAAKKEEPEAFYEVEEPPVDLKDDGRVEEELPYLFRPNPLRGHASTAAPAASPSAASFTPLLGNAIIPGSADQAPDEATMRKFLELRERDVLALSNQLHAALTRVSQLESELLQERAIHAEVAHSARESKDKLAEYDESKERELEPMRMRIRDLEFELKTRTDKMRNLEKEAHAATGEIEKIKERVRQDLLRIRSRERELENRLEILKTDGDLLIASREAKIIELKRRTDLLEFNLDLVQSQHAREKEKVAKLTERLSRAGQAMRVAEGLLDQEKSVGSGAPDAHVSSSSRQKAS